MKFFELYEPKYSVSPFFCSINSRVLIKDDNFLQTNAVIKSRSCQFSKKFAKQALSAALVSFLIFEYVEFWMLQYTLIGNQGKTRVPPLEVYKDNAKNMNQWNIFSITQKPSSKHECIAPPPRNTLRKSRSLDSSVLSVSISKIELCEHANFCVKSESKNWHKRPTETTWALLWNSVLLSKTNTHKMAITSFISKRGWPHTIISDKGINFVAAARDLKIATMSGIATLCVNDKHVGKSFGNSTLPEVRFLFEFGRNCFVVARKWCLRCLAADTWHCQYWQQQCVWLNKSWVPDYRCLWVTIPKI